MRVPRRSLGTCPNATSGRLRGSCGRSRRRPARPAGGRTARRSPPAPPPAPALDRDPGHRPRNRHASRQTTSASRRSPTRPTNHAQPTPPRARNRSTAGLPTGDVATIVAEAEEILSARLPALVHDAYPRTRPLAPASGLPVLVVVGQPTLTHLSYTSLRRLSAFRAGDLGSEYRRRDSYLTTSSNLA